MGLATLRCLCAAILALVAVHAPSAPAHAQAEVRPPGLNVSPAILDTGLVPGVPTRTAVRVTNTATTSLAMRVRAQAFDVEQRVEGGFQSNFDASEWFQFDTPDFLLAPGASRELGMVITAPVEAGPGGHYASVVLEPLMLNAAPADASRVQVSGRVNVLALLTVAGPVTESIVVEEQLRPTRFVFGARPELELVLRNEGNVHTLVAGTIVLERFGMATRTVDVPPTFVLPYTSRRITVGAADAVGTGAYTADGRLTYGSPQQTVMTKTSPFLVAKPASVAAATFILLVAVVLLGRLFVRLRVRMRNQGGAA